MLRELKIRYTEANMSERQEPTIFLEGIDEVIRRDLAKHRALIVQTQGDLDAFTDARKHEIAKKRHYYRQIGRGKFNDDALRKSVDGIRVNIKHFDDKVKQATEKLAHHKLIVDTLTGQLEEYDRVHASLH